MLLNDLPDDCLLLIFASLETLEEYINVSKVCSRWRLLVLYRLAKVKYLLESETRKWLKSTEIYMNHLSILSMPNLHKFIPNVELIDVIRTAQSSRHIDWIVYSCFPSIRGCLLDYLWCGEHIGFCYKTFNHDEQSDRSIGGIYDFDKLHHLFLWSEFHFANLLRCICRGGVLTNPIRLTIYNSFRNVDHTFWKEIKFMNLKILEVHVDCYDPDIPYPGYFVMDACPSLESAYLRSESSLYIIDESIQNLNLRDLVIQYDDDTKTQEWDSLHSLLSKYPNLRHLAIRGNHNIKDAHMQKLVRILPNISIIDFRKSSNVTQKSKKLIENYCHQTGKSITFYYDCDDSESLLWPKIDGEKDDICFGFDFMRHCFFRSFRNLPHVLCV